MVNSKMAERFMCKEQHRLFISKIFLLMFLLYSHCGVICVRSFVVKNSQCLKLYFSFLLVLCM